MKGIDRIDQTVKATSCKPPDSTIRFDEIPVGAFVSVVGTGRVGLKIDSRSVHFFDQGSETAGTCSAVESDMRYLIPRTVRVEVEL